MLCFLHLLNCLKSIKGGVEAVVSFSSFEAALKELLEDLAGIACLWHMQNDIDG